MARKPWEYLVSTDAGADFRVGPHVTMGMTSTISVQVSRAHMICRL
jgi:hypothetical protein